jgi:hypothetical protein
MHGAAVGTTMIEILREGFWSTLEQGQGTGIAHTATTCVALVIATVVTVIILFCHICVLVLAVAYSCRL